MNIRSILWGVLAIPSAIPLFCMEQTCRELQQEMDALIQRQAQLLLWEEQKLQEVGILQNGEMASNREKALIIDMLIKSNKATLEQVADAIETRRQQLLAVVNGDEEVRRKTHVLLETEKKIEHI